MSAVADVLRKARKLYAEAPSHAPAAVTVPPGRYCVVLAIQAAGQWDGVIAHEAFRGLGCAAGTGFLVGWNAESSTETVLAAFDAAIEAEEGR